MSDTPFDQATLQFYADEAPDYVASGDGGHSRYLDDFLARLAPGASILELGCGGGRDSERMIELGFAVDPTDGVAAMAEKAALRLNRAVRILRFDQLDAVGHYDAIWAHASLLHVPRPALPATLASIRRALKPGGWHFANFKSGGVAGRDRFGRYYNYPTAAELRDAYAGAGSWVSIELSEYDGNGYDGRRGPWVGVVVRKPGQMA